MKKLTLDFADRGVVFCLYHAPQGPVLRGQVLHLHPFAEELNTCRRVSAQFARALASAGTPGPSSSTANVARSASIAKLTSPRVLACRMALVIRLTKTCASRA